MKRRYVSTNSFGFEREGTLRQHAFRDGRFVDSYVMARLRP